MTSPLGREYRARCAAGHDMREQLPVLYAWARHPGITVIELGVRAGNSTCALLAGMEHGGGRLWSVDIAPPQVSDVIAGCPWWNFLQADDLGTKAREFCPAAADLLFIDTSHNYLDTVAELTAYAPRVRPGGVVLVHDTHNPADWPDVPRALDDWCSGSGLDWYGHQAWPGLGVIEIPAAGGA
jgi:predicted O-methyltransferase YrrM